jgi:3'-phosphoadenosine 5'-phosphosulfate synthase
MGATATLANEMGSIKVPSDEETLALFKPKDEITTEVDEFIKNHRLAVALRNNPDFTESRPHMRIPEALRPNNFTGGTLQGPGKIVVPPLNFQEKEGKSLVSISYLGTDLCGHPNIVHGGLLATLLDEGLARCCFPAMPNKIAMTANLNINYRRPAPAGTFIVLKARTTKVEGRKAWVEGHIETLVGEGEKPVILVEAEALFIEPKGLSVSFLCCFIFELL